MFSFPHSLSACHSSLSSAWLLPSQISYHTFEENPLISRHKHNQTEEAETQENRVCRDFLGGTMVKNPPANAGDTGSSPGPARAHMPQSN